MPRVDIDNLLSELGVSGAAQPPARPRPAAAPDKPGEPPKPAAPKQPEGPPEGLSKKAMPSILQEIPLDDRPAPAPTPRRPATGGRPKAPTGETLRDIYTPETAEEAAPKADLAQFLLSRNAATAQQVTAAQTIVKQSGEAAGRRRT